jgi:hypothetical protein
MATPSTRQELINYCLRALGEPVLEVNVDPDQIEDRVDQAIQYFNEYHSEGVHTRYIAHQVTQEDVDNKYIVLPETVLQVIRVLPLGSVTNTSLGMFDIQYQMMLDAVNQGQILTGGMAYYEQMMQHLSLLDMKLNGGSPQINWNRYSNQLKLFGDLGNDVLTGDYIVIECAIRIDLNSSDVSTSIYNDMFIKEYTTALIKYQWGANLAKFEGMQLPGGVTLNGRQLMDDAKEEIADLQERLRSEFESPIDFFMG